MKKQKTTTRTLRISEDIDNLLERDSKEKGVSTNSLINSILTKYNTLNGIDILKKLAFAT
jgi:hypothetical protein